MKKYEGDLRITIANRKEFNDLEEVTGSLDVSADFQAPVLTTVGGSLEVSADFQEKWKDFKPLKPVYPIISSNGKDILADGILQHLVS